MIKSHPKPTIVWFRLDLRLSDNPALQAAIQTGGSVLPVFIWAPDEEKPWQPGAASRWWLHQSLVALEKSLKRLGSRLILRQGKSLEVLRELIAETGATSVYWNRRYEPAVIERDKKVKEQLKKDGVLAESFNGALLYEPWTIQTQSGKPYQVFTPFWKACWTAQEPVAPLPAPPTLATPSEWPESASLSGFQLEPKIDWAKGFWEVWTPGETGGFRQLQHFIDQGLYGYPDNRNKPAIPGSSRLSPHLHFGEVSPRQVWHAVQRGSAQSCVRGVFKGAEIYLKEIGWREFAHHLLYHFPHTPEKPLRSAFEKFPWSQDRKLLRKWQEGATGFPIVDAGMNELWATGWMHNRVRMIVASFLVKDLLVSWLEGARWFWDTLVDADLANNTLGWQWAAGCGADAAPFFRIFNPALQAEKFDPSGDYVKHWAAESAALSPIVVHGEARIRALAAYGRLR